MKKNQNLEDLIQKAAEKVDSMSPEEKEIMLKDQSISWARGERRMGSDRQEAFERNIWRALSHFPYSYLFSSLNRGE